MDHSDGIITDHSKDKKDRGDHDGGIAGGCAALQCVHKESGGKNQTIRCQYNSTITGRKAAGLLFPVGAHGGFICFGYGIVSCRREEDVESGSCTCGSDRIIKIVPVCALSNGHHWWCSIRKPFRISGL